jgi:hypothetical protein
MGEFSMRRSALTAVLSLVVALLVVSGSATQASADSVNDIGLTGFRDIIVDEAHDHVFVSQGSATVIVTDLQGVPVTTIGDLPGAAGMTLSQDGTRLYVALSAGDAIAAVDTSALEVTTTYSTGTESCPTDVAVTVDLVWFGSGCNQWDSLRALDPGDGSVSTTSATSRYDPLLRTSPELPGQLFLVERGLSPATIYAYTAQGGDSPSLTLRTSRRDTGSNARDLAITPDGSKLIQASGSPYAHNAYSTSDLSDSGSYGSNSHPNAVAVRDDGMVAAGISGNPDVYIYRAGSTTLLRSFEFDGSANELLPGALAFGATDLYAVTGNASGTNLRLRVIHPVALPSLVLTTDKSAYTDGDTAHVTAELVTDSPNQTLSIYSDVEGERTLLDTGPVDAVSHERTTDLVVTEPTTFVVEYTGSEFVSSATVTQSVTVNGRATTLSLTTDKDAYRYGETAHLTATLASASPNQQVSIFATVDGAKTRILDGTVGPDGSITVDHVVTDDTTFTAEYAGDETYAAASASRAVDLQLRSATVRLATGKPSYRYGEKADLTVRLSTASSNRTVEVYRIVGGNQTLLETGEVPVDGALRLSTRVSERTTFQVNYAGDEATRTATASVVVPVAARVSAQAVGSEGRSGRYHLYDAGHRALVASSVSPNHAGDCLYFRIQYLVNGVFRYDDVTGCARMDPASDAWLKFSTTREARGHAIRARAEWRGDRRNKASASDWQYIRFT